MVDRGSQVPMKTFRAIYLLLIVLMLGGLVFNVLFRDSTFYWFYGYNPSIIGSGKAEAFRAAQETFNARQLTYYINLGITTLCLIFSALAVYLKVFVGYYLGHIILALGICLTAIYLIALTVPKRAF